MEMYKDKKQSYYSNVRYEMLSLIPTKAGIRVLEIGAGGGNTLVAFKESHPDAEVSGIELNPIAGSNQDSALIRKFVFGNIETMDIPFDEEYFDVVLCGDVLEHLIDPWKAIDKIQKLLKPGGVLIASIPNIRHYSAFFKIFLRGNFTYTEHGLFDRTHFRFFCKRDMVAMLSTPKLTVQSANPIFRLLRIKKLQILDALTFGLFREFLSLQYILVAKRSV